MSDGLHLNLAEARSYMRDQQIDGWLVYDYHNVNPIYGQLLGGQRHTTRRCWLYIPTVEETPTLLVQFIDAGKYNELSPDAVKKQVYLTYQDMLEQLRELLRDKKRVAMEYTPEGALPIMSWVDGGTLEMVRGFGLHVVSSDNLYQVAFARLTSEQLAGHKKATAKVCQIMHDAYDYIGKRITAGESVTEYDVDRFIRSLYDQNGLVEGGVIVAANAHAGDPHYEATPEQSSTIRRGDWVLLDLWAREPGENQILADITWDGYVRRNPDDRPSERQQEVFNVVAGARDTAIAYISEQHAAGVTLQGWQVDQTARNYIDQRGYGQYFTHRLGHSLGSHGHGNGVNLDNYETHDTRSILPGLAFTVEPGVYLPEFGVRCEVDVYMDESGPQVTTEIQREIILIG
jgi:Xaa-Pro aminopeptidase